jgi:hypothetical protein
MFSDNIINPSETDEIPLLKLNYIRFKELLMRLGMTPAEPSDATS